mgnify:CR=1 FL=1
MFLIVKTDREGLFKCDKFFRRGNVYPSSLLTRDRNTCKVSERNAFLPTPRSFTLRAPLPYCDRQLRTLYLRPARFGLLSPAVHPSTPNHTRG